MMKINWLIDLFYNLFFKKKEENIVEPIVSVNIKKKLILEDVEIDTKNSLDWKYIVLHHSYSPDNDKINDWIGMKKYHMSWRYKGNTITEEKARTLIKAGVKGVESPDLDIAYNFGLEKIDNKLILQIGRSLSIVGAHCIGYNSKAVGICICGYYDKVTPNQEHIDMLVRIVKALMRYYSIPVINVIGHWESYILLRQAKTKEEAQKIKSCPGLMIDTNEIRRLLI